MALVRLNRPKERERWGGSKAVVALEAARAPLATVCVAVVGALSALVLVQTVAGWF
jgi:hypothetical protein